jgi:hypothetical protein
MEVDRATDNSPNKEVKKRFQEWLSHKCGERYLNHILSASADCGKLGA